MTDFFNYEEKRRQDEQFRERFRQKRRDRELEEMIEAINARTEKEEAKPRPVQVKTFSIE